MAIATARVHINGTWHSLTYNSGSGKWEATLTAPNTTSYNLSGGYYPVTVEATNQAGTVATVTSAHATLGSSLRLVVKERVAPVVTITSPSEGAYLASNRPEIAFTLRDETGGSGIAISTLTLQIGTQTYTNTSAGMTVAAATGGYDCKFIPPSALADGPQTVKINIKDNDGNAAAEKSATFCIVTIPPVLNITTPANGLITAAAAQTVSGVTNDSTLSPVTVKITLNGTDQGAVTVAANGSFSKAITLAEGVNTIIVTSTDSAGNTSSITLTVTLDTTVPAISNVTITPNPVDASASVIISVTIT